MRADIERDPLEWGIRAFGHGELVTARGLFRRAIESQPDNEQAWSWLAPAPRRKRSLRQKHWSVRLR